MPIEAIYDPATMQGLDKRVIVLLQPKLELFRRPKGDEMCSITTGGFLNRLRRVSNRVRLPRHLTVHSLRRTKALFMQAAGTSR
jgi:integrase